MSNVNNISTGTYVIRNVKYPSMCLNIKGSSDQNNGWLILESYSGIDSNYVYVENRGSYNYRMYMPSSGKLLNAAMCSACKWPYEYWATQMGSGATWNFDNVGTVTYNKSTYQKYRINTVISEITYCMDVVNAGQGGPSYTYDESGNKWIIMFAPYDSRYNEWFLCPANPASVGVYEIAPLTMSDKRVAIQGNSTSNGAWLLAANKTGGNEQKVRVENIGSGECKLEFINSDKVIEAANSKVATPGNWLWQWTANSERDQRWSMLPYGTSKVDGCTYPTYRVANVSAEGQTVLMSMCCEARYSDANWLWLDRYGSVPVNTQVFTFIPTEALDTSLPTPAKVGFKVGSSVYTSGTREYATTKGYFECAGTQFECRYRYRSGTTNASGISWGSWTSWMGVSDKVSANDGWGDTWKPNITFSSSANAKETNTLSLPSVTISNSVQVQMQVRSFSTYYKGHSGTQSHGNTASSSTVTLMKRPTLTLSNPTLTSSGFRISYSSDWIAGGCSVSLTSVTVGGSKLVKSEKKVSGVSGSSGTLYVDWANLAFMPSAGSACISKGSIANGYLTSQVASVSAQISTTATFNPNPTYVDSGHGTYVLTPDEGVVSARVFVRNGNDIKEISRRNDGTFDIFVPLNKECPITIVEVTSDGWGASEIVLPAITYRKYIWTFGDGDWAILDLGRGSSPTMESKRERGHVDYETTGREYVATRFVGCKQRDVSVTGCVIEDNSAHGSRDSFERLLDAGHAVFRNPRGETITVAVTAISDPIIDRNYTEIAVTQHEETL